MKTDNIDNYKKYVKTAETIVTELNLHKDIVGNPKSEKYNSQCDKNAYGFNLDNRFSSMSLTVSFDSWRGYYGNSGCSTAIHLGDPEIAKLAFVKYLNAHKDEILLWMSEAIKKRAETYRSDAEKELDDLNKLLKENDND